MTGISYALFITGNPGCGKSFIANNLGANFESGFSRTGCGVTTHVQKAEVYIGGQSVLLIDAPGLIEADLETTQRNAAMITKALSISKQVPYKIGVIVTDHNGRIQQSDLLLIKKVHEALTPKFELLLIVNQIMRRNIKNYQTTDCLQSLVRTIHMNTGANVRTDRVIAIVDFDQEEVPDLTPFTNMLAYMKRQSANDVRLITVSQEEHESVGKKILFYIFRTLEFLASIANAVLFVGHIVM